MCCGGNEKNKLILCVAKSSDIFKGIGVENVNKFYMLPENN